MKPISGVAFDAGRLAAVCAVASRRVFVSMGLAGALAVAGCGGGGDSSGSGSAGGGTSGGSGGQSLGYQVGGVVSGLVGSGLVLTDNAGDALTIGSDGDFAFATRVADRGAYRVEIAVQPTSPAETCVVNPGTGEGHVAGANVMSVRITCSVNMHRLGGTLGGLKGSGLVLREAAGETLSLSADGAFQFVSPKASGASYIVTVASQPSSPTQTCTVGGTSGHGTILDADIADIAVVCSTNAYAVAASVSGLAGGGLVLQQNGSDDLGVLADGALSFLTPVASGAGYNVTVKQQPTAPSQTCTVSGGTGIVTTSDVNGVSVRCATEAFAVGGTVNGLRGAGLVLQDNGADDTPVSTDGRFAFSTRVVSGAGYVVTVRVQPARPAQTCSVSSGAVGTMRGATVSDVAVVCSTNSYAVGGTVQGLFGPGLVLQDNGGDDIAVNADGSFHFPTPVASGSGYAVTVRSWPTSPAQPCVVSQGAGTVQSEAVSSIQVICGSPPAARIAYMTWTFISDSLGPSYGTVTPYALDAATGAMGAPGSAANTGKGGRAIAMAPSGLYAYGPNQLGRNSQLGGGSVQAYVVDPVTGALTENGPEVLTDVGTQAVAVHPTGKWVYAVNKDADSVAAFSVSPATGQLTSIQTQQFGFNSRDIVAHPSGKFVYVAGGRSIGVFAVDSSTGQLTLVSQADSPGYLWRIALDASGRHLFELDASVGNVTSGTLRTYAINASTGALQPTGLTSTGINPQSLGVHPSGRFAYVGNYGMPSSGTGWIANGSISIYTIDPLTGAIASGYEMTTGRGSACMAVDPSGRSLYFQNLGTGTDFTSVVSQYAIDPATGGLSPAALDLRAAGCMTLW